MIIKFQVEESVVDHSLSLLEEFKTQNYMGVSNTCTINGFQTDNVKDFYTDDHKLMLVKDIFIHQSIHFMHLIEYYEGGHQLMHDHLNDDYSFILFLNDSDGNTILYFNDMTISVVPRRGQIIFFRGDVQHEGLPSFQSKKVLAGAISAKNFSEGYTFQWCKNFPI